MRTEHSRCDFSGHRTSMLGLGLSCLPQIHSGRSASRGMSAPMRDDETLKPVYICVCVFMNAYAPGSHPTQDAEIGKATSAYGIDNGVGITSVCTVRALRLMQHTRGAVQARQAERTLVYASDQDGYCWEQVCPLLAHDRHEDSWHSLSYRAFL